MVDSVVGVDCPEGECGGMAVVGCKIGYVSISKRQKIIETIADLKGSMLWIQWV